MAAPQKAQLLDWPQVAGSRSGPKALCQCSVWELVDLNLLDSLSFYLRKLLFSKSPNTLSQDKVLTQCQAVVSQSLFMFSAALLWRTCMFCFQRCVGLDCSTWFVASALCVCWKPSSPGLKSGESTSSEIRSPIPLFSASMPRNAGFAQTCVDLCALRFDSCGRRRGGTALT